MVTKVSQFGAILVLYEFFQRKVWIAHKKYQTSGKLSLFGHFTTKLVKFGHSCNTFKNISYTSMNKR